MQRKIILKRVKKHLDASPRVRGVYFVISPLRKLDIQVPEKRSGDDTLLLSVYGDKYHCVRPPGIELFSCVRAYKQNVVYLAKLFILSFHLLERGFGKTLILVKLLL